MRGHFGVARLQKVHGCIFEDCEEDTEKTLGAGRGIAAFNVSQMSRLCQLYMPLYFAAT